MKLQLLGIFLFLLTQVSQAQKNGIITSSSSHLSTPLRVKLGQSYTQTFSVEERSSIMWIRARHRLSLRKLLKISLPILAGTAVGIFRQKGISSVSEVRQPPSSLMPYIAGGGFASGVNIALTSKQKKILVELTYRNPSGKVLRMESQWIEPKKNAPIVLNNTGDGSVDVSVNAASTQGLTVEVMSLNSVEPDTTADNGTNTYDPENERRVEYYPDYGDVFVGYYINDLWWASMMTFAGYAPNSNEAIYYTNGGYVNGAYYSSGYYTDPGFTEPGGAGYYPMDNPGPAPVNGPGLYPKSRQTEVYRYMWDQQRATGKEQVALMTNEGIFLMPYSKNSLSTFVTQGYPGMNIEQGINGQKSFTYKDRYYRVEGVVHTHPPNDMYNGADGLSSADINDTANFYKAPIFAITDEGIWKGIPNSSPPGQKLTNDYREAFDPNYTISNLYGYL